MKRRHSEVKSVPCLCACFIPASSGNLLHSHQRWTEENMAVNSGNKAPLIPFFTGFHCHITAEEPVEKAMVSSTLPAILQTCES